jgi:hypothetical protein
MRRVHEGGTDVSVIRCCRSCQPIISTMVSPSQVLGRSAIANLQSRASPGAEKQGETLIQSSFTMPILLAAASTCVQLTIARFRIPHVQSCWSPPSSASQRDMVDVPRLGGRELKRSIRRSANSLTHTRGPRSNASQFVVDPTILLPP